MKKGLLLLTTLLCLSLTLLACAPKQSASSILRERMRNIGPIPLSSDNPFLRGNLFVAQEIEDSILIRGFIQHRGIPRVVELKKDTFSSEELYFYYPADREYYRFENVDGTWLVEGPTRLPGQLLAAVTKLTQGQFGTPKLHFDRDTMANFGLSDTPTDTPNMRQEATTPVEIEGKPQQQETPKEKSPSKEPLAKMAKASVKKETINPKLRELWAQVDKRPAEIAPNGDLVHYVVLPGETLSLIARWYTGEQNNVARLVRINQLKEPNRLQIGDSLVIPAYLLKNTNRLTDGTLRQLLELVKAE